MSAVVLLKRLRCFRMSVVVGIRHTDDIRRSIAAVVGGRVHQWRPCPVHRRLLTVLDHPRIQQFDQLN